jgi:hypothetical protein
VKSTKMLVMCNRSKALHPIKMPVIAGINCTTELSVSAYS